jgi:hypothetical protein
MRALKAHVKNGEVVLDNPDEMPPEGTRVIVYLRGVNGIELTGEEVLCLHRSIQPGMTDGDIRALVDVIVKERR